MAGGSGAGSTSSQLNSPWGVYVDSSYAVYVVDRSNHRVQKWPMGKYYLAYIDLLMCTFKS